MNDAIDIFDGRAIPCSEKHGLIINKWLALPVGSAFVLVNNHDPARMRHQFNETWPDTFEWKYLMVGPDEYRIQITKLKPLPATDRPTPFTCNH